MSKLVISSKNGKARQLEIDPEILLGKEVGDKIDGSAVGLPGYRLKLTGGSDKQGFPMRADLPGTSRRKVLLTGPPDYRPNEPVRRRKSVRGREYSREIEQVNCKVVSKKKNVQQIEKLLKRK